MSCKVKKKIFNISCGIEIDMMKSINSYIKKNKCNRSVAIRRLLQTGINTDLKEY